MLRTARSAASRTGSQAFTAAASTVSEKNTFPSETTTSERTRASGKVFPPGDGTLAKAARTCSFVTVIINHPN
jgi:precorrin-4 methylase